MRRPRQSCTSTAPSVHSGCPRRWGDHRHACQRFNDVSAAELAADMTPTIRRKSDKLISKSTTHLSPGGWLPRRVRVARTRWPDGRRAERASMPTHIAAHRPPQTKANRRFIPRTQSGAAGGRPDGRTAVYAALLLLLLCRMTSDKIYTIA